MTYTFTVQFSYSVASDSFRGTAVPRDCSIPGFPFHHQLPELTQTHPVESVMPSNHLILLSSSPPAFNLSQHFFQRVFSSESALHIRWSKYCSFSFSTSPSSEYSGLISFRIDWFDLLAVQGTLKSLHLWVKKFREHYI